MDDTRTLAAFLSDLEFTGLPGDVVATAKLCVLDTVGVALAASTREWTQMVAAEAADLAQPDGCRVWGHAGLRTTPAFAALANGTAAHGIEMDDRVPTVRIHPGANVVPAAIAVSEREHQSGRELISSVVAGYELAIRVGWAGELKHGLHEPGHKGIWGGVAAAGRAMALDHQQMLDAFGIAASMAGGLVEFSEDPRGTMVKRLHGGLAAKNGVLAASLGRRGLTAPATALEGVYGYCASYIGEPQIDALTVDLGAPFRILEREIKPYSAWGGSHTLIEAAAQLMRESGASAADIRHVRVGGSRVLLEKHELPHPASIMAAQFSLPFLTALALTRDPSEFGDPERMWSEATLSDPDLHALVDRVELYQDPEIQAIHLREHHYGGARIRVTLADGSEHERIVYHSKGTRANPMSPSDIEDKFRGLTARVLGDSRAEEVVGMTRELDSLADVAEFTELLSI